MFSNIERRTGALFIAEEVQPAGDAPAALVWPSGRGSGFLRNDHQRERHANGVPVRLAPSLRGNSPAASRERTFATFGATVTSRRRPSTRPDMRTRLRKRGCGWTLFPRQSSRLTGNSQRISATVAGMGLMRRFELVKAGKKKRLPGSHPQSDGERRDQMADPGRAALRKSTLRLAHAEHPNPESDEAIKLRSTNRFRGSELRIRSPLEAWSFLFWRLVLSLSL